MWKGKEESGNGNREQASRDAHPMTVLVNLMEAFELEC